MLRARIDMRREKFCSQFGRLDIGRKPKLYFQQQQQPHTAGEDKGKAQPRIGHEGPEGE
jgi:hypothetical protein